MPMPCRFIVADSAARNVPAALSLFLTRFSSGVFIHRSPTLSTLQDRNVLNLRKSRDDQSLELSHLPLFSSSKLSIPSSSNLTEYPGSEDCQHCSHSLAARNAAWTPGRPDQPFHGSRSVIRRSEPRRHMREPKWQGRLVGAPVAGVARFGTRRRHRHRESSGSTEYQKEGSHRVVRPSPEPYYISTYESSATSSCAILYDIFGERGGFL